VFLLCLSLFLHSATTTTTTTTTSVPHFALRASTTISIVRGRERREERRSSALAPSLSGLLYLFTGLLDLVSQQEGGRQL